MDHTPTATIESGRRGGGRRHPLLAPLVVVLVAMVAVLVTPAPADADGSFWDDDQSIHERQIEGLAAAGITKGCDPPLNSRFCAFSPVLRGQMAAFLDRALDLPAASRDWFIDDNDSIFEDQVNRLAEAGITVGCNPPSNNQFCPDRVVPRKQMAAFLDRALGLPATSRDAFVDDDGSIFEPAINRLAAAGITRGCNPPSNTRFCPDDGVRRGEMASFLVRALDDVDALDPQRLHERTVTYEVQGFDASIPLRDVALLARRANEALYAEVSWNIRHRLLLEQVEADGDFTLWLAADDTIGDLAPGCSDDFSCTIGDDVYINRDNFLDRPATWQPATQAEYQRYLVLHETGHWLDFDDTADTTDDSHYNQARWCVDGEAPVMQQQSIDTNGCDINGFPLPFERDCVEEAWIADTTNQGHGDGDADDQCPHDP